MTSRKLKVYPKYRPLSGYTDRFVPELRLSGIWLERSGFRIGEQVEIIIRNQELVIKPL